MLSVDVSVDNRSPPAADGGAHPAHPPAEVLTRDTRQATAVLTQHTRQATAVLTRHTRRRR